MPVTGEAEPQWRQLNAALERLLDAPEEDRAALLGQLPDPLRHQAEAALAALDEDDLDALAEQRARQRPQAPAAESLLGQDMGGFRLLRVIGTGGMSWVYEAERSQGGALQRVALKRLHPSAMAGPLRQRFREEQHLVGRLQHPGIARLVAAGVDEDGAPWLATQLVDGLPLTHWCDQRRAPLALRLGVFLKVCDAVAAAHRQLIVHRDLKPGNVLVDDGGQPWLLDFGISRLMDPDAEATRAEWRMLTPEYAAPEQLTGAPASTAMDVYALGVILHELLAGRRPLPAHYRDGARTPPTLPSQALGPEAAQSRGASLPALRRRLRGDLDAVVAKALAYEPAERYPSVDALAADVQAVLERRPVAALRHRRLHRLLRFVQRNRAASVLGLLLLASIAAGAGLVLRESAERQQALERSESVERFLLGLFRSAHLSSEEAAQRPVSQLLAMGAAEAGAGLADNPALAARLLQVIATAQDQLDQFEAGLATYARAHEAAELAGDDLFAAEIAVARAALMVRSGQPRDTAEASLREAIATLRAKGGSDRALALALATLTQFETDWQRAEALYREAIARMDRAAPDSTEAITLRSELADLYERNGHPARAVALGEDAHADAVELLGREHLVTARTGFNLARNMRRNGAFADAYALMQRTAPVMQRLLPAAHTDQIGWRIEMATTAATLDALDEADALLQQALELARARPDTPPMLVAVLHSHRSALRERQGRVEQALQDADHAWRALQAMGAADHPQGCWAQNASARLLFDLGRDAQARERLAAPAQCGQALAEARARALWAGGEAAAARAAYERLLVPAPGQASPSSLAMLGPRLRYALLLEQAGMAGRARAQLTHILEAASDAGITRNPELRAAKEALDRLGP